MTTSSPHIVITYPFPIGLLDGGARGVREIARHLGKAGARVTLMTVSAPTRLSYPRDPAPDEALGFEYDEEMAAVNVRIHRVTPNRYHWGLDGLKVRKALRKVLDSGPVDLVLSYYHESGFLPGFLRVRNIRFGFICTWISYKMSLQTPYQKTFLRRTLRKWIDDYLVIRPYQNAEILFAISEFTQQELMETMGIPAERIRQCPMGVRPDFFDIPRDSPEKVNRFIFFGRIQQIKGIEDAYQALQKLIENGHTDWEFRLFGLGNHRWARALAKKYGLEDRVLVHDAVGDERLRAELQAAHLALMPSHSESFGLSNAEAQAAGLPLVGYDAGSVSEVILNGQTAWLAPLRDVDALARNLQAAVENPEETYRRGLAGRKHIGETFSWEITAERILAGLDSLR